MSPRRWIAAARAAWPPGAAGRVLAALIVLGIALRVLTCIATWPTTNLQDSYQLFASNPFQDHLHPAGYGLILKVLGKATREIVVVVLLQHLIGIISALLLGAATRRVTGSQWAGLLPAATVLLSGDLMFLEHSIMSESWEVFVTAIGLYAAVRTFDATSSWAGWALLSAAALSFGALIRTAAVPLIAFAALAMLIGHNGTGWLRWRPALTAAGTAVVLLLAFSAAGAAFGPRFGIAPSPGWYLYGRAAQFADCTKFTPPSGTAGLCETRPESQRPTGYFYMFVNPRATRLIGPFGTNDSLIGGWAKRAVLAQFGDFLQTAWVYLRSYYVPGSMPARLRSSTGLDPQLSFSNPGNAFFNAADLQALNRFFDAFKVHRRHWALQVMRDWQVVFRFGATALFITTILLLVGLCVGTRRSRAGVVLFGLGGLSMLAAPSLTGTYSGRYTVPMSALLMASTAITLTELVRRTRSRQPATDSGVAAPQPGGEAAAG